MNFLQIELSAIWIYLSALEDSLSAISEGLSAICDVQSAIGRIGIANRKIYSRNFIYRVVSGKYRIKFEAAEIASSAAPFCESR